MGERDDLLTRLRGVDEILARARPRAPQQAWLLARLRAADRARQSQSSSVPPPWLAIQRAWRPLGVTAGLCAALAFALALGVRAGDHAQQSVETSQSRGTLEPTATRRSLTQSPPRPRAEGPRHRTPTIAPRSERAPVAPAPERSEASPWALQPRAVPWGSELPSPSPRLSSRDEPPLRSDAFPVERDPLSSSAARARGAPASIDEPRVLWAEGHAETAPKPAGAPARRGQSTPPAPGSHASGCEPAERLVDRARADCESQALALSDHGLAYLDACGDGQFRGLDYACAPASAPHTSPPSAKVPAGCVYENLLLDGACKTEEDTRAEALHRCEEAGLALAELNLDQGSCSDGFEGARALCCEKGSEDAPGRSVPKTKHVCTDESDPDCLK
ncbi:Hypothetical protein A7982_02059 [Minicystis rosea]|nr:Hypothetical protein A7982_02059 [Minicystis rosea]